MGGGPRPRGPDLPVPGTLEVEPVALGARHLRHLPGQQRLGYLHHVLGAVCEDAVDDLPTRLGVVRGTRADDVGDEHRRRSRVPDEDAPHPHDQELRTLQGPDRERPPRRQQAGSDPAQRQPHRHRFQFAKPIAVEAGALAVPGRGAELPGGRAGDGSQAHPRLLERPPSDRLDAGHRERCGASRLPRRRPAGLALSLHGMQGTDQDGMGRPRLRPR